VRSEFNGRIYVPSPLVKVDITCELSAVIYIIVSFGAVPSRRVIFPPIGFCLGGESESFEPVVTSNNLSPLV